MDEFRQTTDDLRQRQIWLQAILDSAADLTTLTQRICPPEGGGKTALDCLWHSDDGKTHQQHTEPVRRAVASLLALVNRVVDLSNSELGTFQLERVDFDLKSVIDQTLKMIGRGARAKKLNLKTVIQPDTPAIVCGDAVRLKQVLFNLLDNAIKFTPGGDIVLSVRPDREKPNFIRFEVADSGIGIPADRLESILEHSQPDSRGKASRHGGAGVGLEFCQMLVKQMGGKLQAQSVVGEGSTFSFNVILAAGALHDAGASQIVSFTNSLRRTPAGNTAGAPIRILIAEDSEDSRYLLQEFLRDGPYEITFVENGRHALEATRFQAFDLILMDIQMPVMDGLTATRLIRKAERERGHNETPLLALTANARKADIDLSRSAGCNAHVLKPISRIELLNAIEKFARKQTQSKTALMELSIPSGLEDAAKRYILSKKNDIPEWMKLVHAAEFDQLRLVAHDMKGTGTSYGFPDLTRLGWLMEYSAEERNLADLSNQILELSRYVEGAAELLLKQDSAALASSSAT